MFSIRKVWTVALISLLALTASVVSAQDFNQLKGNSGRTGKNSNPALYGPGIANLTWFQPNGVNLAQAVVRNNTSTVTNRTGTWLAPPAGGEASFVYNPGRTANAAYNLILGSFPTPAYEYVGVRASQHGSHNDPRLGATATFTWSLDPGVENPLTPFENYQVYVWLPNGPTFDGTINQFPIRYFVYEITDGNGNVWIDVVDRNVVGQGWARLGNGGRDTTKLYAGGPGRPIQVRLFNTVWRDANDELTEPFHLTNPADPTSDILDFPGDSVVYADAAMIVPDRGSYQASPVVGTVTVAAGTRTQTIGARNVNSATVQSGVNTTISNGEVTAYNFGTGQVLWKWSPLEGTDFINTFDNTTATASLNWTSEAIVPHSGGDYLTSIIQNTNAATPETVTYTPALQDGTYQIQVYCGGDQLGETFGHSTQINVIEGANPPVAVNIDQSQAGWVTISNRRFFHSATAPLSVQITNYSPDAADIGRKAFADSVRFVGSVNSTISSTPVQAKVWINLGGGFRVEKDVVLVASDSGHLYCLDAEGRADGTTLVYWAYPSILPSTVTDPNSVATEDGGVAIYPSSGFGMSSPTVVRTDPNTDLIYIAAQNGRVYCINSDGRGDFNAATGQLGTTTRRWTYPNDYPATVSPALGNVDGISFMGSLAFSNNPIGGPTIYVPSMEGRMYALDAVGGANKTTTVRWQYPARTTDTLGPIATTPAVEFGKIYFGTARKDDTALGQFMAMNAETGALIWERDASDDFLGGPATASAAELGTGTNMVFASNQNRFIYAYNADDGTPIWADDELNTTVRGNLTFTYLTTFDTLGATVPFPLIMVPTEDGRFDGLFARPTDVTVSGTSRLAYEYVSAADSVVASIAVGYNFMYGADSGGNLYAWSNAAGGAISPGIAPGTQTVVENDPAGADYRNAKIAFITRTAYQLLRESIAADPTGDTGNASYTDLPTFLSGHPLAFEWGETVYMLVYDFPFDETTPNGTVTSPPVVQFQIAVDGAAMRQFGVQAKKWNGGATPGVNDGYAVLAFPIQGSGPSSLPPGAAKVTFAITTSALRDNAAPQNVRLNPATSSVAFTVANPIGLTMPDPVSGIASALRTFGTGLNPATAERNSNGSPIIAGGINGARFGQSEGVVGHGQSGEGSFWITDMSLMTLLKGNNRGLEAVRMSRPELAWQGGAGEVYKPIDQTLYPNYEDLPVNFPNTSLDYPNIGRDSVRATKDPNGTPENLIVNPSGVALIPPSNVDENAPLTRTTNLTPAVINVDVPRFQPANNRNNFPTTDSYFLDNAATSIPSGYAGRVNIFVDSNGNGVFDSIGGRREAYRSFTTNVAVAIDERLQITTPTVDLGSLAGGTLFSPNYPNSGGLIDSSPWLPGPTYPAGTKVTNNSDYYNLFKPFVVEAPGNVNMLNVRVVKGVSGGPNPGPWPIYSNSVDDLGWLDASMALWSDIDHDYSLMPMVLLQKGRVGDVTNPTLNTNPKRRYNPNIGVLESLLFPAGPAPANPRLALSPPIGQPNGTYAQKIQVFESLIDPLSDFVHVDGNNNPLEVMSNPGVEIRYTDREARATTGFTKNTSSMIDFPQPAASGQNITFGNLQPAATRDLNGSLLVAFTSDRPSLDAGHPTDTNTNPAYRIYLSGLAGKAPNAASSTSPLRDLYAWGPNGSRWFKPVAGPFPAGPFATLFPLNPGESIVAGTEKFGGAAFPAKGFVNPLNPSNNFNSTFMAFVGQAQKQTVDGRLSESRIMVATVTPQGNGQYTIGNPVSMPFDPNTPKGRLSLYQTTGGAVIFYPTTGNGSGALNYTTFVPSGAGFEFTRPVQLNMGSGFEALGSPSVALRPYTGQGTAGGNNNLVEMTFSGKLVGRANSEIFYGRMNTTGPVDAPGTPLYLPSITSEPLVAEREVGVYRAQGVVWNPRFNTTLALANGSPLEDTTQPRTIDRNTGIIKIRTTLGGDAYLDPNLGTVRFGTGLPPRNSQVVLTYQPRFLRLSENTASGHAGSSILFDDRLVGDLSSFSYWFRASGGGLSNLLPNDAPRSDRYFFTYNRASAGAGTSAQPLWKSMRFGAQLLNKIGTNNGGGIVNLTITPAPSGPVQVDPSNGRVYFQKADEGSTFTFAYTDPQGIAHTNEVVTVGLVVERNEQPVPVDQAVNESALTPFLDPFDAVPARPGLIWMFYVSTRTGGPDVYFQTMAPRFTPIVKRTN